MKNLLVNGTMVKLANGTTFAVDTNKNALVDVANPGMAISLDYYNDDLTYTLNRTFDIVEIAMSKDKFVALVDMLKKEDWKPAFKGLNPDMTTKGMKFDFDVVYAEDQAIVCKTGLHACERAIDVMKYHSPNTSDYYAVSQAGDFSYSEKDSKVSSTKMKLDKKLSIFDFIDTVIADEYAETSDDCYFLESDDDASVILGAYAGNIVGSEKDVTIAHTTGAGQVVANTGNKAIASAQANDCVAVATGKHSLALAKGDNTIAVGNGDGVCAFAATPGAIAVSVGNKPKAKGVAGSLLILGTMINGRMVRKVLTVDGIFTKENTIYTLDDRGAVVRYTV